jgi:hypothetical protein
MARIVGRESENENLPIPGAHLMKNVVVISPHGSLAWVFDTSSAAVVLGLVSKGEELWILECSRLFADLLPTFTKQKHFTTHGAKPAGQRSGLTPFIY